MRRQEDSLTLSIERKVNAFSSVIINRWSILKLDAKKKRMDNDNTDSLVIEIKTDSYIYLEYRLDVNST